MQGNLGFASALDSHLFRLFKTKNDFFSLPMASLTAMPKLNSYARGTGLRTCAPLPALRN